MTQREINKAIEKSLEEFGKDATIKALNTMYHAGLITIDQVLKALDTINK